MTSYRKGWYSEKLAIVILRLKGYKILSHRFKTRWGEIDIVATRNSYIVFVEVKFRPSYFCAVSSITSIQQRRIQQAALFYLAKNHSNIYVNTRFDVLAFWRWRWQHIKNVWI